MPYYHAAFARPEKPHHSKDGENRTRWEIETSWHKLDTHYVPKEAYTKESENHKILRWVSNDSVVPNDIMEVATGAFGEPWPFKEEMKAARAIDQAAAITAYIEAQANRTPEQVAEQQREWELW